MTADCPNRVFHGGKTYRAHADGEEQLLDVSASVNPFAPAVDCTFTVADVAEYPDDSYMELKEAISGVFHRSVDEICVGNGSVEIMRTYCQASIGSVCRIDAPTFGEYALSAQLAGKEVSSDVHSWDVRFICNPNNPTGTVFERDEMCRIIADAEERNRQLFVDEAFMALAETDESVADIASEHLFVLRSLTKSYSVPGLRFGFGFGPEELIEKMEIIRAPWAVNSFAEKYAIAALAVYPQLKRSAEKITHEREWYFDELEKRRLVYFAAKANFICINVGRSATEVTAKMLEHGVYVRDCTSFGLPQNIRVSVETREKNKQVLEALDSCLR